jgi:hypothetical protein
MNKWAAAALTIMAFPVAAAEIPERYFDSGFQAIEWSNRCKAIRDNAKPESGSVNLPKDFNSGLCWGMASVVRANAIWAIALENSTSQFVYTRACIPSTVTTYQFILVVLRYIDQHPEHGHLDFLDAASAAAYEAFPCPTK